MQLKCLETVREIESMQNSADSRIIGDQSILHFPVGVSRSENILYLSVNLRKKFIDKFVIRHLSHKLCSDQS